jgi:molybdate transport system substrate-binding protein
MPDTDRLTVFAASSLRNVLPALCRAFRQVRPDAPDFALVFAASGALTARVRGGVAVDLVVFASEPLVSDLVRGGFVAAGASRVVASNRLVLIGRAASGLTLRTLDRLAPGKSLVIGDPSSVPAGQYAQRVLDRLGLWDALAERVVYEPDVAAVLDRARRDASTCAIVYRSDVVGVHDVDVLDEVRPELAAADVVAAVPTTSRHPAAARSLLDFICEPDGQQLLGRFGFAKVAPRERPQPEPQQLR